MKAYFIQLMLENGFLASNLFYAMLAHEQEHIEQYLEATGQAFKLIAEALEKGTLETKLKGNPAVSGFKRIA